MSFITPSAGVLFDLSGTDMFCFKRVCEAVGFPYDESPTLHGWLLPQLRGRPLLDRLVAFALILFPFPIVPEVVAGLFFASFAYIKWVLILSFNGLPFMLGLVLLVWMHMPWMWLLWCPLFFTYFVVRTCALFIPIRMRLVVQVWCWTFQEVKATLLMQGGHTQNQFAEQPTPNTSEHLSNP